MIESNRKQEGYDTDTRTETDTDSKQMSGRRAVPHGDAPLLATERG